LTEAEASFRALKSELSVRPLFHQLESRVKAHVLVAFHPHSEAGRNLGCSGTAATRLVAESRAQLRTESSA
jgi:hypothetical protein